MESQSLTGALRETLAVFTPGAPLTTPEVADTLDLGRRATYSRLEQLVEANRLETKKVGASARVWWRPVPDGAALGEATAARDRPESDPGDRREFERLVEAVDEYAIFTLDADGYVQTWNPGVEQIKGYEADDILGEHFSVFYTEADREAEVPEANLTEAASEGTIEEEGWRVRKDGSRFWANVTITPIRDDDGSLDGYAKVTRDMTRRREYERSLERQAERLERERDELESELDEVFERISDGFYALDEEFRFLYLNDHAKDVLGLDDSAIGQNLLEVVTTTDAFEQALYEARGTQEPVIFEDYYDPVERWFHNALYPSETGLSVYFREITDRKRREQELKRYEVLTERSRDVNVVLNTDGTFRYVSPSVEDELGYSPNALVGENAFDYIHPGDREDVVEAFDALVEDPVREPTVEHRFRRGDGSWAIIESRGRNLSDDPDIDGIVVYSRNVTERKEREQELERSRALLRHTEQLVEVGGWEADLETGEQRWTQGLFDIHDVDVDGVDQQQVPAMEEYFSFVAPEHRESFRRAVERSVTDGEPYDEEIRITTAEGRDRWIRTICTPVVEDDGVVALRGAARDITEDKKRERQLSALINNVPGMVYRCRNEPEWPVEFVSDACSELTGYDREVLEGGEVEWGKDVVVEKERERVWETVQRELTDGTTFSETYRIETADGDRRWVKDIGRGIVDDAGETSAIEGIIQDVTERVERELKLEQYEQIVETVADGIYVLDEQRRFTMVNDRFVSMTEFDRAELLGAHAETVFGEIFVEIADEKQAELESSEIDIAVLEEELYRADGTTLAVESRFDLFEGPDSKTGRVGVVRDVSDRVAREQELEALNSINEVSNEIIDAVIQKSTREEIEAAVCEHLADSDSYLFAWVGDVDSTTETVNLRTEAGVEGYLDEITISVDPDDERSQGPTGRALLTGEMQTTHDIYADSQHDPWRDHIEAYEFRSSAAIPIAHGESVYGVLNVYSERPYAFEGREGEVISRIGEVIGHAIAATERKRALMSDEVVELEFQIRNMFEMVGVSAINERITLDHAVPRGDDAFLVYGTTAPGAIEAVTELVDAIPHWDSITVLSEGDTIHFELQLTEPPVLSVVATLGGYYESFVIENGDLSMSIHLSPGVDARRVSEAVEEAYPQAQMVRRRQISRSETGANHVTRQIVTDLTDRQRAVLDAAYHAGYFEWPRDTDGSEVAESLGIAPSTFSHHLRKAEQKVLNTLYEFPDRTSAEY